MHNIYILYTYYIHTIYISNPYIYILYTYYVHTIYMLYVKMLLLIKALFLKVIPKWYYF